MDLDRVFKQLRGESESILKLVASQRKKMEESFGQIVLKSEKQNDVAKKKLSEDFKQLESEYSKHVEEYKVRTETYLSAITEAYDELETKHREFKEYSQKSIDEVKFEMARYKEIFKNSRDARKRLIKEKNEKYTDQVVKDIILLLGL